MSHISSPQIYLDQAATSHPKPPEVLNAMMAALTSYNANPGRSGHKRSLEGAMTVLRCREALAALLGAPDPLGIIFCLNCTDALNLAIKGSLYRGDHVISTVLEHNSVLRVLKQLEKSGQIELTLLTPDLFGQVHPGQFADAVQKNTRLAVVTHASNVTGIVQPVEEISQAMRDAGVRVLVDGAQAAGTRPVDVQKIGCDLYAFPGHKGLLGPQGTGGLVLNGNVPLRPLREGGTGSSSESVYQPEECPERYESGTLNLPGVAGLLAGTEYVQRHQAERMEKEHALTRRLLSGLSQIPGIQVYFPSGEVVSRVGVVSLNVEGLGSSLVADALDQADIAVRGGLHCAPLMHAHMGTLASGTVRVSLDAGNTAAEIDRLLYVLERLAKEAANIRR